MSRDSGRSGMPDRHIDRPRDAARPIWLSAEERERFRALGRGRFTDAAYQRYAQSHRSHTSLSQAGKEGWAATVRTHGAEYAWDRAAAKRRDSPSSDERRMMSVLRQIDAPDYRREYKVAPRTHVDVAWPERRQALEVYGAVHFGPLFDPSGARAAYDRAREERIEQLGWELLIITYDDLKRDNLDKTMGVLRGFLGLEEAQQ